MDKLYQNRFLVFIASLAFFVFGDLVFPDNFYNDVLAPIFLIILVLSGILLIYRNKRSRLVFIGILLVVILTHLVERIDMSKEQTMDYVRFGMFFLFFAIVTLEVISQVWQSTYVDTTVILGVMSGYVCLALLGFFIFMTLDIMEPGSFSGIRDGGAASNDGRADLLYFSFITMLTIGYGEILPTTDLSKNATVLIGLLGQFYLVIITAIVVGKFLSQKPSAK